MKCDLMRDGKCSCSTKCVKYIYYNLAIKEFKEELLSNSLIDKVMINSVADKLTIQRQK